MSADVMVDMTTGMNFVLVDFVQGPAGTPGGAGNDVLTSVIGPVTTNVTYLETNEITCSGGAVVLNFPAGTPGIWAILKFLAGDPSGAHSVTLSPPAGKNIEGILGVGATVPGTYYSSLLFNASGLQGTSIRFYVNSGGNIAVSG